MFHPRLREPTHSPRGTFSLTNTIKMGPEIFAVKINFLLLPYTYSWIRIRIENNSWIQNPLKNVCGSSALISVVEPVTF